MTSRTVGVCSNGSTTKFKASQPWKITIAEDLQNNEWITKSTGAGGAGFGSQWESAFVHPIRQAIITPNDSDRDMGP